MEDWSSIYLVVESRAIRINREVVKYKMVYELIVGEPWVEYVTRACLDNVIDWSDEHFGSITFLEARRFRRTMFLKHEVFYKTS